jgi:hypothetical protein
MAVPTAPRTFVVTGTVVGELKLTWIAPLTPGGDLINYKIYSSIDVITATSASTLVATVGTTVLIYYNVLSDTGSKRYFAITAVNADGEGAIATYTWEPIIVMNPLNHLTESISTFVFTLTGAAGIDVYNLAPYLYGYRVIGGVFSAGAAGGFAYIDKTRKKVTSGTVATISFTVFAIRQMEP